VIAQSDPEVMRLVVKCLRWKADLIQEKFGERSQMSQPAISRLEGGEGVPSEADLRRMAKTAGVPWPVVVHLIRFFTTFCSTADRLARAGNELEGAMLDAVLLSVAPYLFEEDAAAPERPAPEEERREADEIWSALERFPPARRRELIELGPRQSLTGALVARIREASAQAAAHRPAEALEIADLARFVAERMDE
jgi:transcriptional regulator with XRE-family HTH domain